MKNFAYLPIENWQKISEKLYQYSFDHSKIHEDIKFWTWQNQKKILEYVPELAQWLSKENITPVWMTFIRASEQQFPNLRVPIHVDTVSKKPQYSLRLLFPVHGCDGSINTFYRVPKEDFLPACGMDREEYFEIYNDYTHYEVIERFELNAPVVFDTSVPHTVDLPTDFKGFRLSLSILTEGSLERYLK